MMARMINALMRWCETSDSANDQWPGTVKGDSRGSTNERCPGEVIGGNSDNVNDTCPRSGDGWLRWQQEISMSRCGNGWLEWQHNDQHANVKMCDKSDSTRMVYVLVSWWSRACCLQPGKDTLTQERVEMRSEKPLAPKKRATNNLENLLMWFEGDSPIDTAPYCSTPTNITPWST